MSLLIFDPEKHEYHLGERRLPSVSEILKDLRLIDDSFFNDYATDKGKKVHLMTQYYDEGDLDETSLDPELRGYLAAYHAFRQAVPMSWCAIEAPFYDEQLGYAGTPDRIGLLPNTTIVVEIKTAQAISKWWRLQLSAYQKLAKTHERMSVRLSSDGRFRVDTYQDTNDGVAWTAALNLYNWKHGG